MDEKQFYLNFVSEDRQQIERKFDGLLFFENPSNDNEVLLNAQYRFFESGDISFLWAEYELMMQIAKKIIHKFVNEKGLSFSSEYINDKAMDAVLLKIKEIKKGHPVKKYFIASLCDKCKEVLFKQTNAQKFEDWIVKNNIPIDFNNMETYKEIYLKETNERS